MSAQDVHNGKLHQLASKFNHRAFTIRSVEEQHEHKSASGAEMKRCLGPFDLVMMGLGGIIGAGVFVLTGVAARSYAGPGVILSYALAAFAALISALCYAEFAAELPVAGGAFNYVSLTFGEYAAWVVACDLILEYTLSAAAVAKGFTAYLAALIGIRTSSLRLERGIFSLDIPAAAAVVLLSLVLARSMASSSHLNNIVSGINVVLIVFVVAAGLPHANVQNYTPFAPFGVRGIFSGASVVFFSFIGFDTVATTAEEAKNPSRDLPIGIVGSLLLSTVLYVLMCLTICGMQPYYEIDMDAPFAVAFTKVGMGWAQRLVAAGALTGITTSLLVSLLGQARIYVTLGRARLLPLWFARVRQGSGTPVNATCVTACTAGVLALLFEIEVLAELVSIGTLFVFFMVCSGVLYRRYHITGSGQPAGPVLGRLLAVALASVAFSISYTEGAPEAVPVLCLVAWLGATISFYLLPVKYVPAVFKVPLSPFLPCAGILATLHLIGSLGWPAYVRWVVWWVLGTSVYISYGMHNTQQETHLSPQPSGIVIDPPGPEDGAAGDGSGQGLQMVEVAQPGSARSSWSPGRPVRKKASSDKMSLLGEGVLRSDAQLQRPGSSLL